MTSAPATGVVVDRRAERRQPETALSASRLDDSLGMVDHILRGVRQLSLDLRPSLLDVIVREAASRGPAISMRPALLACTESPQPGLTTTTQVSALPATSTST